MQVPILDSVKCKMLPSSQSRKNRPALPPLCVLRLLAQVLCHSKPAPKLLLAHCNHLMNHTRSRSYFPKVELLSSQKHTRYIRLFCWSPLLWDLCNKGKVTNLQKKINNYCQPFAGTHPGNGLFRCDTTEQRAWPYKAQEICRNRAISMVCRVALARRRKRLGCSDDRLIHT